MVEIKLDPDTFDDDLDRLILQEREEEERMRKSFLNGASLEDTLFQSNLDHYSSFEFFQKTFHNLRCFWEDITNKNIPLTNIELIYMRDAVKDAIADLLLRVKNGEKLSSDSFSSSLEAEAMQIFLNTCYEIPFGTFGSNLLNIRDKKNQKIFQDFIKSLHDKKKGRMSLGETLAESQEDETREAVFEILKKDDKEKRILRRMKPKKAA